MKVTSEHLIERLGVHRVGAAAAGELKWLFRELVTSDVGIDGELEPVIDGQASGLILGLQIKSGESYFREATDAGVVYRGDDDHLEYWSKYANPVVLALHRPSDGLLLWQVISDDTVERTERGWKLVVPRRQQFSRLSSNDLLGVARREFTGFDRIRTDVQEPLVAIARSHAALVVEAAEWVNKSSGRTDFRLLRVAPEGKEDELDRWTNFLGRTPVAEALQRLFPWSSPQIDEAFYESYDEARFDEENGIWDAEDGRYVHFDTFSEWSARHLPDGLRPYTDDGEVAYWRVLLEPDLIYWADDIVRGLPATHPDREEWSAALETAEATHQAEPYLRRLAERIVGEYALPE